MNINRKWKDWRLEEEDKESVNEAVKNLSVHFPKRTMKQMKDVEKFVKKRIPRAKFKQKGNILHIDGGGNPLKRLSNDIYNNFYVDKVMWESVNEAVKVQAGSDPLTVQDSLLDAFKGIVAKGTINWGYSESDQYGWNDFNNFKKMNDEYNKEMLKIGKQVEGISKQLEGMWKVYEKVKGKWRKKDGPRTN